MKREILFRGKRIDSGEWVEGLLIANFDGNYSIQVRHDFDGMEYFATYKVDPETVCQFIGGKGFEDAKNEHFVKGESNEVKLFEGDIVEAWSEGGKGIFVIKMRTEAQPTFMLYPNGQHGKMWNIAFSDIGSDKFDYYDDLRKIGNIHDNPEFMPKN